MKVPVPLMRCPLCALTTVAAAACGFPDQGPGPLDAWPVSEQPVLVVADTTPPTGHELYRVWSAVRLADGRVVVANSGLSELAIFDSIGHFERAIGRRGQGPNEFQGALHIFQYGDSLAILDAGLLRWTVLANDLTAARTAASTDPPLPRPTWLYHGAIVTDGVPAGIPAWILSVIDTLRASDPEYSKLIIARRDDVGALWVRDADDSTRWSVYGETNGPHAVVTLPAALRPVQLGFDFVVGIGTDADGRESIHVHTLRRTGRPPVASSPSIDLRLVPEGNLLGILPNLITAQERYYADHGTYAAIPDSLPEYDHSYRLFLLEGDKRHWQGIAVDQRTGVTCGISIGFPAPPGWLDGYPFCGR